jgi:Xaa-Pro aminopeptidase
VCVRASAQPFPLILSLLLKPAIFLQAEYRCRMLGAARMSYPPVVAAGPDAFFTHYGRNDKVIRDGQMVLMDAGCELHG